MLRPLVSLVACASLVGCGGVNADDVPLPQPASSACGDADPTISELTIEDAGVRDYGGTSYPTVRIQARASDADGDLHYYLMRVWWSEDAAEAEGMEGEYVEVWGTIAEEPCTTQTAVLQVDIAVAGNPPEDTELTWAVLVYDDQEHPSDAGAPWVETFTTPAAP